VVVLVNQSYDLTFAGQPTTTRVSTDLKRIYIDPFVSDVNDKIKFLH